MKINSISQVEYEEIEIIDDEEEERFFQRYNSDNWKEVIGCSVADVYDCTELEKLYNESFEVPFAKRVSPFQKSEEICEEHMIQSMEEEDLTMDDFEEL